MFRNEKLCEPVGQSVSSLFLPISHKIMPGGQSIHFSVKIGKYEVLHCHELATDFYETSHVY